MKDEIAVHVARVIGARRKQLGLTLRALAALSGVSSSMISDIERGSKSPTISTLSALAGALSVPISALVDGSTAADRRFQVVRASERLPFIDPTSGAKREDFGPPIAGSRVEFLQFAVPPRTVVGPFPAHATGTIEHIHLAAGRLRVTLGSDAVMLEAGDSCTCLADAPHGFDNSDSSIEALMYIVIEPT
jgi:transcriptional regulator with XRE-family HTH domain